MSTDTFDDTNPHIVLAETRQTARTLVKDVAEHDRKIETLDEKVARIDERVRFLARTYWLVIAGVGSLVVDAVVRHLH